MLDERAIALAGAADSSQRGDSEAVTKMKSAFRSWSKRNSDQSEARLELQSPYKQLGDKIIPNYEDVRQ
jgi:hypothetical protein